MLALPGAAAAVDINTDAEGSATLTGLQSEQLKISIDGSAVECTNVKFSGTLSKPAEQATLHPTFEGCKAFGFLSATVTSTGCDFVFHVGEVVAETKVPGSEYAGTADIACETGKKITIVASTCEATIGAQSGLGKVAYVNVFEATPEEFRIDFRGMAPTATKTKDGFLCPFSGTGTTSAAVNGKVLVEASAGGKQVGARIGHTSAAWIVGGTYLGGGSSATVPFSNSGSVSFKVPAIPFKVACSTFTGKEVLHGGIPGSGEFTQINIAGCSAQEPAGCTLTEYGWEYPWPATLEPGISSLSFYQHTREFRVFFSVTGAGCPPEEIFFVGEPRLSWLNGTSTIEPQITFSGAAFTSVSGVPATISGLLNFAEAEGGGKVWGERVGVP